jgi:tellurite resistance protein TerC
MNPLPVPVAPQRPAWLTWLRRIGIAIAGGAVLLVGIAMIVLPGPAFLMIPAGLAILGLEFAWARRWLKKAREKAKALADKAKK